MEEKFRIKEYNEGQEEDKEEKYRDKNKSFDDTEQRTPRLIRMILRLRERRATDESLENIEIAVYSESWRSCESLAAAPMRLCG